MDYKLLSEGRTPQYLGIHFSVLVPYKGKGAVKLLQGEKQVEEGLYSIVESRTPSQ
jgi:hypothetical protein